MRWFFSSLVPSLSLMDVCLSCRAHQAGSGRRAASLAIVMSCCAILGSVAAGRAFAWQDEPTDPSQIATPIPDEPMTDEHGQDGDHDHEHEPAEAPKPELIQGDLANGDLAGVDGGLYDQHVITVEQDFRRLVIDLRSPVFDTVLVVEKLGPDGEADPQQTWRNDDSNNVTDSSLDIIVSEPGEYRITVMSWDETSRGPYTLNIQRATTVNLNERVLRTDMGTLTEDDPIYETTATNSDSFEIELEKPTRLSVDVWSDEFDTYVAMQRIENGQPVFGQEWYNDDYGGSQQHSRIDADVPAGTYRIIVASYSAGTGGNYEMRALASDVPPGVALTPATDGQQLDDGWQIGPNVGVDGEGLTELGERVEVGILNRFDRQNAAGAYYDRYELQVFRGQRVRLLLRSGDFDTLLRVNMLDENDDADPNIAWVNDDSEEVHGDEASSLIEFVAPFDGVYRVVVTSFAAGELGRYELNIQQSIPGAAAGGIANVQVADGERLEVGNLGPFDQVDDNGNRFDAYKITVVEGETYTLDLNATGFDPVLRVTSAHDEFYVVENDDYEGSTSRSLVQFTAPVSGEFDVRVGSYAVGGEGVYQLIIRSGTVQEQGGGVPLGVPNAVEPSSQELEGELTSEDASTDGHYYDEHLLEGTRGQQVRIDLEAEGFDSYLILESPTGRLLETDDFQGSETRSVLETVLSETGAYKVRVTSYDADETGSYTLKMELSGNGGVDASGLLVSGSQFSVDLTDETLLEAGGVGQVFEFEAEEGTRVTISMISADFDTLMRITYPDGTQETFDDSADANARYDARVPQTGRYKIEATSFSGEETGRYQLTFEKFGADAPPNQGKRILGVFIGIAEYPNGEGNLERCDIDAKRVYDVMRETYGMQLEDSSLLLNADATREAVQEAVERIGQRATADDTLIFFYSGHGSQFDGPAQPSDPDGLHETITLVNGDLIDDQLAGLINASAAGTALVVLDSCYSGGFAKDVVSAPGRIGIFASEEDVLAQVAEDYEAGGYLSRFIVDALDTERKKADRNQDDRLSAFELCHYLGERYRDEVRSEKQADEDSEPAVVGDEETPAQAAGEENAADAVRRLLGKRSPLIAYRFNQDVDPGEDLSFQRLVVDRGGVRADTILFAW